jgi:phage baseplate assembly protein gpV
MQRDVKKREDNSDFLAGIRIDPQGLIELKTSDDIVITLDQQNGKISLLCKDKPIELTCDKLTVDGDVEIKKTLTVDGDGTITGTGKISKVTISGTDITGGA